MVEFICRQWQRDNDSSWTYGHYRTLIRSNTLRVYWYAIGVLLQLQEVLKIVFWYILTSALRDAAISGFAIKTDLFFFSLFVVILCLYFSAKCHYTYDRPSHCIFAAFLLFVFMLVLLCFVLLPMNTDLHKTSLRSVPTSADNAALPAFAAARLTAARLLLTAGRRSCSDRSISPARRAHSGKPARAARSGRMM